MNEPIVRFDADGTLDEFIAEGVDVHFEAMDTNRWWIGVNFPDGTMWHIDCGAKNPRAQAFANAWSERSAIETEATK